MFTRQTLVNLSTKKVFARGEDLWQSGAVRKLTQPAPNRFEARVRGTTSYRTEAWLASGNVQFGCDCPYDMEGICKHAVALGLTILDTQGGRLGTVAAAAPATASNPLPQATAAAWEVSSDAQKLDFLRLALAKNDDLARQFLAFATPAAGADKKNPKAQPTAPDPLQNLAERLTEALSTLDFGDQFWEDHEEAFYNDEDNDVIADTIREALEPFVAELMQLARTGQLTLALRYWATACAAIYQVEEPAADTYGSFGDYGTDALRYWHAALAAADWPDLLLTAVLPPTETAAALAWVAASLANPPARWPGFDESWLPLLHALADEPATAAHLPGLLQAANFGPVAAARLHLHLAETAADDTAWVAAAETLLPHDAAVAQRLLAHYATPATKNPGALLAAAATAFATWPDRFGNFVLATYTAAAAPALYPAALRHRALANHSLPDFEALRPLLDAPAIAAFVAEARTRAEGHHHGLAFVAALLAQEASPAALKKFVLGFEWVALTPADFEPALHQLALADPANLLTELQTRLPAYLNGRAQAKRGGVLYTAIARWLAVAYAAVPALTEPVLRLAQALRDEFPSLHLLKEALLKEKLLPNWPVGKGKKGGQG